LNKGFKINTEKDFGAIKKKPLSYGFINKGDIWFALKYNFTDELTMRNRIGQNLVDFAWIDSKIVITSLQMLWDTYTQARNKKDEYSFITVAILERTKRFLSANVYLSVYLFAFIDFLLEDTIDERVVSKDFIFDSDLLDKFQFFFIFAFCLPYFSIYIDMTEDDQKAECFYTITKSIYAPNKNGIVNANLWINEDDDELK
jgi:hypothetical protein